MAALTVSPEDEKRVKGLGFLSNRGTDNFNARVLTVNGKITCEQARILTEAAEKFGNGNLEFTTRLTVEVPGIPYEQIEPFREYIAQAGLVTGGTGAKVRPVVSCKGTTCQYGLLDSFGLSEKIHNEFYTKWHDVTLPHKFKICVGGCPNNCVKPPLNDVGIMGQRIPNYNYDLCKGCKKCKIEAVCPVGAAKVVDKKITIDESKCLHCGRCVGKCLFDSVTDGQYGYKIFVGGRWGKNISHGKALNKFFTTEEEVMDTIAKVILFFREYGIKGERLAVTIDRIGFDKANEIILGDELLKRKEEILAKEL